MKILILDDSNIILEAQKIFILDGMKHSKKKIDSIDSFHKSKELLKMEKVKYDISFIDWNLNNGISAKDVIKKMNERLGKIIIVTEDDSEKVNEFCKENNFMLLNKRTFRLKVKDILEEVDT